MTFEIKREELLATERVVLGEWTAPLLASLSQSVADLAQVSGFEPVQRGRVIALRCTDTEGRFSAFKASLYHGRYDDGANTDRFVERIAARHQSYEPIRGESVLFLFVAVGKTVYDALAMFGQGRLSRISGGFHHSLPWGIEVPVQTEDRGAFTDRMMPAVRRVIDLHESLEKVLHTPEERGETLEGVLRRALAEARYEMPLCHLVAPFAMEFSEEALMTKVFPQRLWERGVAGRDSGAVVRDMWDCCVALDDKFQRLYDLHGPHVHQWEDALRRLRDAGTTAEELASRLTQAAASCPDQRALDALLSAI